MHLIINFTQKHINSDYLLHGRGSVSVGTANKKVFSSAVPPGSGAFQMPTRPSASASAAASASTLRGEGPISETLQ